MLTLSILIELPICATLCERSLKKAAAERTHGEAQNKHTPRVFPHSSQLHNVPFLRRCSSLGGNLAPLPPVVCGGAVSRAASQPVKTGERIQVRFADLLPTLPTKTFHRQNSARVGATQGCIAEFLPSYLFCRGPFPCIVVALVVHHLARKPFHDSFLARTVWQGANALIPPAPT